MNDINKCSPSFGSSLQTAALPEMQVSSLANPSYPVCQVAGDTYLDVDTSGHYSAPDMVFGPDGIQLNPEQVQQKLKSLGYNPDFVGCFAASAPTCYGDLEQLRLKHGMWPANFSVIAAADAASVSCGNAFTAQLSSALVRAFSPSDTQAIFQNYAYNSPYIAADFFEGIQNSVGWLGAFPGWFYQPDEVRQDSSRRYLIVITANDRAHENHPEENWGNSIQRIIDRYQLQPDHVHQIESPEYKVGLQTELHVIAGQFSTEQANEVMIIYAAHGYLSSPEINWSWSTKLHDGFFSDTILTEREFRDIMIGAFPPEKAASVLLLVESCFSGQLVDEEYIPPWYVAEQRK